MNVGVPGVALATFLASFVEMVEALTIVLAMGVARSWRSALWGTAVAVAVLALISIVLGATVAALVSRAALQLAVGLLGLIFGLQWLRKSILRSAGLKALHDEEATYREEQEAARAAGREERFGLDWYAFVVSFKGVLLEGLEVVFIVLTFGATAHSIPLAAAAAAAAGLIVLGLGLAVHRPLSRVPENTVKYVVGLLLATFGVFWVVEGLGVFSDSGASIVWPGGDAALLALLGSWILASQLLIRAVRPRTAIVVGD